MSRSSSSAPRALDAAIESSVRIRFCCCHAGCSAALRRNQVTKPPRAARTYVLHKEFFGCIVRLVGRGGRGHSHDVSKMEPMEPEILTRGAGQMGAIFSFIQSVSTILYCFLVIYLCYFHNRYCILDHKDGI